MNTIAQTADPAADMAAGFEVVDSEASTPTNSTVTEASPVAPMAPAAPGATPVMAQPGRTVPALVPSLGSRILACMARVGDQGYRLLSTRLGVAGLLVLLTLTTLVSSVKIRTLRAELAEVEAAAHSMAAAAQRAEIEAEEAKGRARTEARNPWFMKLNRWWW